MATIDPVAPRGYILTPQTSFDAARPRGHLDDPACLSARQFDLCNVFGKENAKLVCDNQKDCPGFVCWRDDSRGCYLVLNPAAVIPANPAVALKDTQDGYWKPGTTLHYRDKDVVIPNDTSETTTRSTVVTVVHTVIQDLQSQSQTPSIPISAATPSESPKSSNLQETTTTNQVGEPDSTRTVTSIISKTPTSAVGAPLETQGGQARSPSSPAADTSTNLNLYLLIFTVLFVTVVLLFTIIILRMRAEKRGRRGLWKKMSADKVGPAIPKAQNQQLPPSPHRMVSVRCSMPPISVLNVPAEPAPVYENFNSDLKRAPASTLFGGLSLQPTPEADNVISELDDRRWHTLTGSSNHSLNSCTSATHLFTVPLEIHVLDEENDVEVIHRDDVALKKEGEEEEKKRIKKDGDADSAEYDDGVLLPSYSRF
ncbi:hypothetical protein HDU97_004750 [Phlyctochytrium planicorne]|nr:hypothetical protein HDU97_004750 [Phlyctochytrium planicorne]